VQNPQKIHAGRVTAAFVRVLQVQPMLGRTFLSDENDAGHDHVVVLSYEIWRQRFGLDSNIVGQTIRLDENQYEVVGVMPHDFDFSIPGSYGPMDVWIPVVLTRDNSERGHNYLNVIARLKSGVTPQQAQADMSIIAARLVRQYFWHGCPTCGHIPKTNFGYWAAKIASNRRRDRANSIRLRTEGFRVLRFWEHSLNSMPQDASEKFAGC
jgi:MacB-like periplasmic core domain